MSASAPASASAATPVRRKWSSAGILYDPAADAAAAVDAEVPGEAVDEQALAEAEVVETQASADAESAATAGDEQAG